MKCKLCLSKSTNLLFFAKNIHGRHVLSQDRFKIYWCQNCKVAFTDVEINDTYYKKYYRKNYYQYNQCAILISKVLCLLREISFRNKLKMIRRYSPSGSKILEIGCAKGDFLHWLPPSFQKYGIEINEIGYQYIKDNYDDIVAYKVKIDGAGLKNGSKYDIIVMWHVFEHIDNPINFVKSISCMLAEGGIIIFDIPNQNSVGFRLTKRAWFHLDAPRHLFYYGYDTISWLLRQNNFEIVNYSANAIDYFQDLAVSFYMKFKTNSLFLNIFIAAVVIPPSLIIRLLTALLKPNISETNTYVVKSHFKYGKHKRKE